MTTSLAKGMVTHIMNVGTNTARGATQYTARFTSPGSISSLDMSLMASATGWSSPKGPTRVGPIRI